MEYAIEAIKLGSTAIGIATTEGVVLAVEKRVTSTLMEPQSVQKIMEIDNHIGICHGVYMAVHVNDMHCSCCLSCVGQGVL